jgi:hypothetical protein
MSWRAIQNKNKSHKDTFQKELGQTQYEPFDDEHTEFYTFLYSLCMKITEELPSKSEKEWVDMLQYKLQDFGFDTKLHSSCLNAFYFQENQLVIVSKSANPSIIFKLKQECSSVIVICLQDIKEYCFEENGCVIKYV